MFVNIHIVVLMFVKMIILVCMNIHIVVLIFVKRTY